MSQRASSGAISIRTSKVSELDALAAAMDRSRNYVINQAIEQYLESNAWQLERVKEGVTAAREGKVVPAEEVFSKIAAKHGWTP